MAANGTCHARSTTGNETSGNELAVKIVAIVRRRNAKEEIAFEMKEEKVSYVIFPKLLCSQYIGNPFLQTR